MIVDLGSRTVSLEIDDATAAFEPMGATEIAIAEGAIDRAGMRRTLVELRQFHGGSAPHVLIGGIFQPGGNSLRLRVAYSAGEVGRRTCRSRLRRRKLVPGLPEEHVESALAGLCRTAVLPFGVLSLDRAGYDPVETSPLITELAAEVVGRALSLSAPPSEREVADWLSALP